MTTGQVKDEEERGDGADVKKQVVEDVGGLTQCDNQIGLGVEKTVVLKLDWRIVTLLFVLCPFRPFIHKLLLNSAKLPAFRSSCNPGSF